MRRVIVVGAGMGGLAAAADLARQGRSVTVLERASGPGGKLRSVDVDGQAIDAGPTVFTMHEVFAELFRDCGQRFEDHLQLERAGILARHAWRSGGVLDLHADVQRSAAAIREFAGEREAQGYLELCQRSARVYATLRDSFMMVARPSPAQLVGRLGARGLAAMWSTPPWQSLWQALGAHFRDPRLRQLFGRYATYVGSSPLAAPATLMLIAHVEQSGVWLVRGGMREVARALENLGRSQGVVYRYDAPVQRILTRNGRASGVELQSGEILDADAVVFNGDANALASGALGDNVRVATGVIAPQQRGLSAVTWCLHARTSGFELQHHNVFFAADYPREFSAIFADRRITAEPTVYLCAQDRSDSKEVTADPQGRERMLLLVNAPADGDRGGVDDASLATLEQRVFELLQACDLQIDYRPGDGVVTRPQDFERLFPCTGGALYGRANHGAFASFEKPASQTPIAGLYLAGGSAHPGPGIPMATLSGRLAAARLAADAS
ncbi:MAG: phytoene desaturase [Sinobacteraceae bacterium]|nr:phytoene desaturase [Nevskiaceae bacterium]